MGREDIDNIIERWNNEPDFRDEMKKDPEGAVRQANINLSDEEISLVRDLDWQTADDEMEKGGRLGIIHHVCTAIKDDA